MKKSIVLLSVLLLAVLVSFGTADVARAAVLSLADWCPQYGSWDGSTCSIAGGAYISSSDTVTIADGETLIITVRLLSVVGTLNNNGTVYAADAGVDIYGTLYNNGTVNADGTGIQILSTGILNNKPSGVINGVRGAIFTRGVLNNQGTINSNWTLIVNATGVLSNSGTIINITTEPTRQSVNQGIINNYGLFENKGFFDNVDGTINNDGLLKNYRCPGEVGVITAGETNITGTGSIEYITGRDC